MTDNINQFFLSISFSRGSKPYYFSCPTDEFKSGEYIIVETVRGTEVGIVIREPLPLSEYKSDLALKPIIKKADENEIARHYQNLDDAQEALAFCAKQIEYLKLDMHLISAEYTFDRDKIIFTYVADQRVDFRELLKILASQLRTRIELRQIGSRDKAKLVGGVGVCGLPLCCNLFLRDFDGISINRAKNQNLTLNIPKLTGQCSRLMCCLAYEDDYYKETNKRFPPIGQAIKLRGEKYFVNSFNVISEEVKLTNENDTIIVSLEEIKGKWKNTNEEE